MSKISEFFAWFEGYTEGIEKPTAKQWDRIRARVAEMRIETANGSSVAPVEDDFAEMSAASNTTANVAKPKLAPTNKASWIALYIEAMIQLGCDGESAKEFGAEVAYNKTMDPAEKAGEDFRKFFPDKAA